MSKQTDLWIAIVLTVPMTILTVWYLYREEVVPWMEKRRSAKKMKAR